MELLVPEDANHRGMLYPTEVQTCPRVSQRGGGEAGIKIVVLLGLFDF